MSTIMLYKKLQTNLGLVFKTLFLLICCLLVSSCDKKSSDKESIENGSNPKSNTVKTLIFGHDMPEDSAHHLAAVYFADLVHKRSNGTLKIDINPAETIATDREMIAMAQSGALDIILPPTAKLTSTQPSMKIFDIPYLFEDHKQAYKILDGTVGRLLLKELEQHNLVGVSYWESGFKQITSNRAINSVNDFSNLRVRIMPSNVIQTQFELLGSKTAVIDFSKTRDALLNNGVDAQENPLGSIYNMGFHQVQSHLYLSNHGYLAQVFAFSKKSFANLTQEQQAILKNAALEATDYQRKEALKRESYYLNKLNNTNIKIGAFPNEIKSKLVDIKNVILEKYRVNIGTRIVESLFMEVENPYTYKDDELIIGLDADMLGNSANSGLAIRRGIELAIDEINQNGGVLGKKLKLIVRDNSMISARGIENLHEFRKMPNLVAVVGGISSPVALSQLEQIHKHKILYLDPWAAATNIVDNGYFPNYVYRVSVRDEYAGDFLLSEALKISGRIGLMLVNNGWGRSNHKAISSALANHQLSATEVQWFDWGEANFENKLLSMVESGVEVIIYVGNPVEADKLIKVMIADNKKIPIVSHWGITGGEFTKMVGADLNNIDLRVLQTFSFIGNKRDIATKVYLSYKKKYSIQSPRDIVSPTGTAHAYDLIHLLALAIKTSGEYDMTSIRNALETIERYDGLVKDYHPPFTKERHDALNKDDFIIAKYIDGVIVPVEPLEK